MMNDAMTRTHPDLHLVFALGPDGERWVKPSELLGLLATGDLWEVRRVMWSSAADDWSWARLEVFPGGARIGAGASGDALIWLHKSECRLALSTIRFGAQHWSGGIS
jgi:hypothetical protein